METYDSVSDLIDRELAKEIVSAVSACWSTGVGGGDRLDRLALTLVERHGLERPWWAERVEQR